VEGRWCFGRIVMCCSKERILQPAQGHNTDKEGKTEASVGGGEGPEG